MSITRASTNPDGSQANEDNFAPSLSADGTRVAFISEATDLGDPPSPSGTLSVFVKDLTTGELIRASSTAAGTPLTGGTGETAALAANGGIVVFDTNASELIGSTQQTQLAVKDLATGTISLASTAADGALGDGPSFAGSPSPDGNLVAFTSNASNLVAGDTNGTFDVFVKTMATGAITRVSTAADGTQADGNSLSSTALAADGSSVAFQSTASNLVAGDTNGTTDIFVKNLATGAITRASTAADGTQANGSSSFDSLSRDGNLVAFTSEASNLVPDDTNGSADVFVKNLTTGAITRVSTAADGTQGNPAGIRAQARISADGTKVAFSSGASNLVPGDTNNTTDVFVKDLTTGAINRVSTAADGTQGNSFSASAPSLSADGSRVAFDNGSSNLVPGDTNGAFDVFVADVICFATGTRLRTARGEIAVEELLVGDQVVTAGGALRPIRWIGARSLDGQGRPLPFSQQPVRIRAGAFGDGLPVRDLFLSPGHPVLVGDHLVPVMVLLNGTSLARMPVEAVTYWHVELDAHDILLAEGLPAESYLDLGSRPWFSGSDAPLHDPDLAAADAPGRCRPVVVEGPVVEAERRRLDAVFAASLAGACAWDEADLPWITA